VSPPGISSPLAAAGALFEACVPTIPYIPAAAFLAGERRKLRPREGGPARVALVADGIGAGHGLTSALAQLRELGVPGFEVEVIGTDARVDRRLPAVADVDVPLYEGLRLGVPSLPALADVLIDGRYDLVHLCSPGPAGVAAALIARTMGLPLVGTHHTELGQYAQLRSGDARLRAGVDWLLTRLYAGCQIVLSPSESSDASLHALGVAPERVARWGRGVDGERFRPDRGAAGVTGGEPVTVLYAGRLSSEKGVDLLADAFAQARARDPRLRLTLAGEGPERERVARRLGRHATFLGWLDGDALADAYGGADIFLFPSSTDTFGQVVLEAQASGVPVVAVDAGGPATLIEDGRTGMLRPADATALADALCELAASPLARRRLAEAARRQVAGRTWERCMAQLGACYAQALRDARRLRPAMAA
jgi:glycosyltransferase involved in cell wall biosynthesis